MTNRSHDPTLHQTTEGKYVAIQQDCKRTKSPEISNVAKPYYRYQAATWEPRTTRRCPQSVHHLDEELHLNEIEANMSTRGTQQDLINLLYICWFRKGFMKDEFCVKQCFIFQNRGGEARIMEHFQMRWEDYSITEVYHLYIPPNHFQHLVLQRSPILKLFQQLKLQGSPLSISSRRHPSFVINKF